MNLDVDEWFKTYKILVINLVTKEEKIFDSIEEASEHTHISEKRIRHCIETGNKWKCRVFDEVEG